MPRRLLTAPTNPIIAGYTPATDLEVLQQIATHYHGAKGDFSYVCFRWINTMLFGGELPTTLIQWGLTAYGGCLGLTQPRAERYPVITLHPSIWQGGPERWQPGPRKTLDVLIHECIHVAVGYLRGQETGRRHSSHDNRPWASECMRLAPLLGLGAIQAAPTTRTWVDGSDSRKYTRATPPGCLDMAVLSRFPYALRPAGYFQETALPWD